MAGVKPFKTVCMFYEMIRSESRLQLWAILLNLSEMFPAIMERLFVGYDNACGLAAVAKNPSRSNFSKGAKIVSKIKFIHDRQHLKNHKKDVCQAQYNIDNFPGTKLWNTECAEQEFLPSKTVSRTKNEFQGHLI